MVGSSKILTVSYGTFSCTLEGFDEPFSTMKAIAEYFRNLAAEDRYFGAEPPTPDAAMLHQIAEHAIQKKVEAKVEENAVTLRQTDAVAEDTPLDAAETAEMMDILNAGVDEPAQTAAQMLADAPQTHSTAETDEDEDAPLESAAEKLARLRALVASSEGGDYTEDEHAEDVAISESAEPANDATVDTVGPTDDATAKAETVEDAVAIAAPLQALIEEQTPVEAEETIPAEPVEEVADAVDTIVDEPAEDVSKMPVSSIDDQLAAEDDDDDFDLDSLTAALADDVPDGAEAPTDSLAREDAPIDLDPVVEDVEDPVVVAEEVAEETAEEIAVEDVPQTELPVAAEDTAPDDTRDTAQELEPSRPRVRRVRVIKARKADVPAEAELDALPEVKRRVEVPQTDETAVARLLEATDDQMKGDETRRRQDAFVLAKAAVAAARAEETDENEDTLASASAAYRRDLEEVVRPSAKTGGPKLAPLVLVSEQRVDAPLADVAQVVSDGNLALKQDDHVEQVAAEDALDDATSFSDFADQVGAVEMNDLLEAAAAYASHVEGRSEFTRPVIMRHVEAARGSEEFSREEGLRSFGTLLRNGTIRKLKRGKFEIADTNKFAEDARAVGE